MNIFKQIIDKLLRKKTIKSRKLNTKMDNWRKLTGRSLTARQHFWRDLAFNRVPFGLGENKKRSVLVVPELRKPRSKRDPVLLAQQMERAK